MFRPLCLLLISASSFAAEDIRFNRDIRPILSENCFYCHGQDPKHREAGLRLDQRDEAIKAHDGVVAIVPGHPAQSEMLKRLASTDVDEQMPPPESHRKVSPAQVELLRRWIAQGAPYEKHWAFLPPERSALPQVADASWARQPLDRFVLARLETEKLAPATAALPSAWLRRAAFDLTGLPPTPGEMQAFEVDVAQRGEAAFASAADRLLGSPRFGERLAQDWLDVARYADTHGFNNDSARSMWRWRDYVIESFNADLPFDQFITEQLAGDLLPKPTLNQRLATAFNRNHVINSEGGIIEEEYRVEYVADRVRTTSTALLGLTMECARCHDHKYDPLTAKDFYRMFAFFNNVQEYGEDGRIANAVPLIPTPTAVQAAQIQELQARLETAKAALQKRPATHGSTPSLVKIPAAPELVAKISTAPTATKAGRMAGPTLSAPRIIAKEAGIDPKRGTTLSFWMSPDATEAADVAILSALDRSGSTAGVGYGNGRELRLIAGELEWIASTKYPAYATVVRTQGASLQSAPSPRHIALLIQGKESFADVRIFVDGIELPTTARHDGLTGVPAARDWHVGADGVAPAFKGKVTGIKSFPTILTAEQIATLRLGEASVHAPASNWKEQLARQQARSADFARVIEARTALRAQQRNLPTTMVMVESAIPRQAAVLVRGQYDAPGEAVQAGVPEALIAPWPKDAPKNRLGLARWFLQPQHPLTARVVVNRFWAQLFGVGLVKTVEDFGTQGEWPSHPEVLDTLARDFVDGGWNTKALFKSLVLSATYRQSSDAAPALYARDPENRLLARGPRVRLTSEQIRDQALAVAGLLTEKIGGPSVRPYQPDGLYKGIVVDAPYPSTTWDTSQGADLYRRSLYTFWKRTAPHPAMLTFDSPDREFCSARRSRTNTPLQALVLWNETGYLEASRRLGERMLKEGGPDDASRVAFAFRAAVGRTPRPDESAVLRRTLSRMRADFLARPDDAAKLIKVGASAADPRLSAVELAAAAAVANLILTLDETITKN